MCENLKFSKLRNYNDFSIDFENLESFTGENFGMMTQNKNKIIALLNDVFKEYLQRIKLEKEFSLVSQQEKVVSHKLSELKKKIQIKKEDKQTKDREKEFWRNILNLYQQNLGLKIEPVNDQASISTKENAVAFIFYNINEDDHEKEYSFILVLDDSKYKVRNCSPLAGGLKDLVSNLNRTYDLHSFAVNMRRKFKESIDK